MVMVLWSGDGSCDSLLMVLLMVQEMVLVMFSSVCRWFKYSVMVYVILLNNGFVKKF